MAERRDTKIDSWERVNTKRAMADICIDMWTQG